MSEAEDAGATPGEEPAVNEENNHAEVDPNDPMAGYREKLPSANGGGGPV